MRNLSRVLVALCAVLLVSGLALAAGSGSSPGGHVTRLGPGQSYKGPDGREVTAGKGNVGDVIVTEFLDDGRVVSVEVEFPKGTSGEAKKFEKGDKLKVKGGKAKLKDVDDADITIDNGGDVDIEGCDNDQFEYDGAGSVHGGDPSGAKSNNNNDADLNAHAGASFSASGSNNKIHN